MYSNPRVLTYENAPINSGIKSVYPELSHVKVTFYNFCYKDNKYIRSCRMLYPLIHLKFHF